MRLERQEQKVRGLCLQLTFSVPSMVQGNLVDGLDRDKASQIFNPAGNAALQDQGMKLSSDMVVAIYTQQGGERAVEAYRELRQVGCHILHEDLRHAEKRVASLNLLPYTPPTPLLWQPCLRTNHRQGRLALHAFTVCGLSSSTLDKLV
jgi:hypothetical protein